MSKYQFLKSNIYQEGNNLPINKFNISDKDLLSAFENELIKTATSVVQFTYLVDSEKPLKAL